MTVLESNLTLFLVILSAGSSVGNLLRWDGGQYDRKWNENFPKRVGELRTTQRRQFYKKFWLSSKINNLPKTNTNQRNAAIQTNNLCAKQFFLTNFDLLIHQTDTSKSTSFNWLLSLIRLIHETIATVEHGAKHAGWSVGKVGRKFQWYKLG